MDTGAASRGRSSDARPVRARPAPILLAVLALLLAVLAMLLPGAARAQERPGPPRPSPAAAPPARPAAPDPAFEAAKAAFEALPEAERRTLQDALVWTGDFNAVVSGAFGRRTFEALNAFRARGGADPLDPRGRAALVAAGEAAKAAARFRIAADPGSGAVLGVPERLLPRRTTLPAGTRWQSADGRVTLETRAYPPGAETLDALFERATAPMPERTVTYKLRRPDALVVTAQTGTGLSYVRYASGPQGVRGFLIGYDRALAPEVDRLVIAVANAFDPFPAAAPAAAPSTARAPPASAAPPAAPAPPAAAQAAPAGTGLVVAPGRVLTASAALEGCSAPRIGSGAARVIATDPAVGLALLEAPGVPAPVRPPARAEPVPADEALIALAAGPDGVSAAPGSAVAGGVIAPLQPGASGAPVLDRAGRLAGLVARYPAAPRRVAGVVPPLRVPLVPAEAVFAFLAGKEAAGGEPRRDSGPLGASVPAVAPAVVGLLCR